MIDGKHHVDLYPDEDVGDVVLWDGKSAAKVTMQAMADALIRVCVYEVETSGRQIGGVAGDPVESGNARYCVCAEALGIL